VSSGSLPDGERAGLQASRPYHPWHDSDLWQPGRGL